MDESLKEIRQVLLGKTQKSEDGTLRTVQHRQLCSFQGASAGVGALRFLGISRKNWVCSPQKPVSAEKLKKIVKTQGQMVYLEKTPDVLAYLCRNWMLNPVLITAAQENKRIIISTYTARSIFAPLSCRRALKALEKRLSGTIEKTKKARSNGRKTG